MYIYIYIHIHIGVYIYTHIYMLKSPTTHTAGQECLSVGVDGVKVLPRKNVQEKPDHASLNSGGWVS